MNIKKISSACIAVVLIVCVVFFNGLVYADDSVIALYGKTHGNILELFKPESCISEDEIIVTIPYTSEYFNKPIEEFKAEDFPEADLLEIRGALIPGEEASYREIKLVLKDGNKIEETVDALNESNKIISSAFRTELRSYGYLNDAGVPDSHSRYILNTNFLITFKETQNDWRPLIEDFEFITDRSGLYIEPAFHIGSGGFYKFWIMDDSTMSVDSLFYYMDRLKEDERVENVYFDVYDVDVPSIPGDVDDNGVVSAGDALLALQMAVGKREIESNKVRQAADLVWHGEDHGYDLAFITTRDALAILQKAVGKTK